MPAQAIHVGGTQICIADSRQQPKKIHCSERLAKQNATYIAESNLHPKKAANFMLKRISASFTLQPGQEILTTRGKRLTPLPAPPCHPAVMTHAMIERKKTEQKTARRRVTFGRFCELKPSTPTPIDF
jgi:hypothetical protein